MSWIFKLDRRDFLKTGIAFAGGLMLGCYPRATGPARILGSSSSFSLNAFLAVGVDNSVTVIVNKSEMGQGVYTALPMIVAEELDCDWKGVGVQPAPVAPVYNHTRFGTQVTGGSTSVRTEWDRLSLAGATARQMLRLAAAQAWKVDVSRLKTENGRVIHPDGRTITYGDLALKAAKLPVPRWVRRKAPSRYTLIGRPIHRLDAPAKVSGKAVFGIDVQPSGMPVALLARAPVFGATLREFNDERTKAVPGVKTVVAVPAGVAVVADGFWQALKGREALQVTWDEGPGARLSTEGIRRRYTALARTPGVPARREGNVAVALAEADRTLEAEFEVPFLAHAPMEPLNCCVELRPDGCDIWTGTQMQTGDRDTAARITGLAPEKVRLHTTYLGGGFGRRANPASDFVAEAAQVATALGGPVKVIRTREDDMRAGYYRPMCRHRLVAGIDRHGRLTAWRQTIVCQSIMAGTLFSGMVKGGIDPTSVEGSADLPYAVANLLVDLHSPTLPVPVQWWRSVGHSHAAFAVESFMDELAHATEQDPVAFRTGLLQEHHPRHLGVLALAAQKAGWGTPPATGRGRGVAVHASFGSYVAQVAEVSVEPAGRIRVHRVVCAVDCGRLVNPDTIAAQMESAIVFGLTAALKGAITLENGRVQQGNFDDYPLLRIDETPQVEVYIVPSTEPPGGIGEPGVPPIAPAVANAVFAATGERLRSLPLRPSHRT